MEYVLYFLIAILVVSLFPFVDYWAVNKILERKEKEK